MHYCWSLNADISSVIFENLFHVSQWQNEIFAVAVSSWKKCEKVDAVGAVRESCYDNLHKFIMCFRGWLMTSIKSCAKRHLKSDNSPKHTPLHSLRSFWFRVYIDVTQKTTLMEQQINISRSIAQRSCFRRVFKAYGSLRTKTKTIN